MVICINIYIIKRLNRDKLTFLCKGEKMKITHLMIVDKFTEPFIEFINNNFDTSQHEFLVIGKADDARITSRSNVFRYSKRIRNAVPIIRSLFSSKSIIVHGLFSPHIVAMYYIFPSLLKKSSWVVWGGDLYYYNTRDNKFKSSIYEYIRKKVIKNFSELITLTEGDYNLAKQWYSVRGNYSKGIYINPITIEMIESNKIECNSSSDINIMIGNSADPSNNHIEVLHLLEKFKDKNINIFAPLSYGNALYAEEVCKIGKRIFGDRFHPILEFYPPERYLEFLSMMDIGIFAHDRQQAIFNITILAYLNRRIFLKPNVSTWDYFVEELGLEFYNYEDINCNTFEDLFTMALRTSNTDKIKHLFDENYSRSVWSEIFKKSDPIK